MRQMNRQLVSQVLEGVPKKVLEKYQGIIREFVHRRHGVYALYRRGKLYYVGLASNLRSRLHHHLEDRHANAWDTFSVYLTINERHMRQLEALVLRIALPEGNRQKGGLGKAENVRRKFRKAITTYQREELQSLFSDGRVRKIAANKLEKLKNAPKLAPYVSNSFRIKMRHKGKWHWAGVRSNGMIVLRGKKFNAPSMAADSIVRRGAINGWVHWLYQRAPGDWVPLDKLRH